MVVFDNWKFRKILKNIVEKKELNGDRISSKQQLYIRIGEALHVYRKRLNIGREINPVDRILENQNFWMNWRVIWDIRKALCKRR